MKDVEMDAKTKINQYRERLDKTLACGDLTDENTIRKNVESQLILSHENKTKGDFRILLEKRTNELVDFLGMLRSATLNDDRVTSLSEQSSSEWKVKQDTEECRVMYREGPPGTPFHELLVEGYLDGPVDACLCVAWETSLYKKWWPQFNYPAFKVTSSQCIHQIGINEKICNLRVKVPWPLSPREALMHYYEFEFFQEDLIIVTIKTIDDVESDGCLYGFSNGNLPESNNVVRIGVIGGLAIQKVNNERCYFRMIASLDMKLDFVSPTLINFIARQLIGNGFKLCQKAVASISKSNKDFSEALEGPMYNRIRLASNLPKSIGSFETEFVETDEGNMLVYGNDTVDKIKTSTTSLIEILEDISLNVEQHGEPEIEEEEDNPTLPQLPSVKVAKNCNGNNMKKVHLRPEVEQAMHTLDKVIEAVRERRRGLGVLQQSPPKTHTYELPSSSRGMKSGLTVGEVNTEILVENCSEQHQSSTNEITSASVANNLAAVGSTSKVYNGMYKRTKNNIEVRRKRFHNICCSCWSGYSKHG